MTTPDEAIDVLNRIHEADPSVLPALIGYRVPCNQELAKDPTVQVGAPPGSPGGPYEVGLLGIINGLFGVDEQSWGFIAMVCAKDDGRLIRFERTPER